MKSRIFLLLISLTATLPVLSCRPEYVYRNQDLWMFRAVADDEDELIFSKGTIDENVSLWEETIGKKFDTSDIVQIVYKTPLDSLRRLSAKDTNPFARRLLQPKYRDLLDFLLVAKEVEEVRGRMGDVWYYPTDDDAEHAQLNILLDKCRAGMNGTLAPRYAVQAIRILTQMGKYEDVVAFWNEHQHRLPKNVLRRMAADHVGGAYDHLGDKERAKQMYVESENKIALQNMLTKTADTSRSYISLTVANIESFLAMLPNARGLRHNVQYVVRDYEKEIKCQYASFADSSGKNTFQRRDSLYNIKAYRKLRSIAVSATKNRAVKNKAFWHYTAAYLYYLDGHDGAAAYHLAMAECSPASQFDRESIHAFRILFDTDTRSLTRSEWLANLRWIEERVSGELDYINSLYYWDDNVMGYTISYWYDVMRKVCERGADRLVKAGDTTLALQISNYCNYRLYSLLHIKDGFGFCDLFFKRMDILSAAQAEAFAQRVAHPQDALDKFLVAGGCFDRDYIGEHVGTLYLREMNYAKACEWLEGVSCDYQNHTNVKEYFYWAPFQWADASRRIGDNTDYKLNFARRMLTLEREMTQNKDANRRANAKLNYAIGLRNSFGRCWALTYYRCGETFWDEDFYGGNPTCSSSREGFKNVKHARNAYAKFDRLVKEALNEFTSDEILAQVYLRMMNFKTVREKYPNTAAARSIEYSCDTYYDYALQKR